MKNIYGKEIKLPDLKKPFETVVYIIMCICSFGMVWLARILISQAIREANK